MGYILVEYSVCIYIISLEIYYILIYSKTCIITEFVSYKTFKGQRRFSPHLHNTSESNSSYLHVHFRRLALTRCQNVLHKTHEKNTCLLQASSKNNLSTINTQTKTVWKVPTLLVVFTKTSFLLRRGKAPNLPRHHEIPQVFCRTNSHLDSGAFHRLGSTCRGVAAQGGGFTNQALMHQGVPRCQVWPTGIPKKKGKFWGFGNFSV